MVECTKNMLQSLQNAVESGQTEFEIGEYMSRLTADIIARTEFDSSYEKGKQIFHLLTSLQHLCAQASRHLCFPGSRLVFFFYIIYSYGDSNPRSPASNSSEVLTK